MKIRHEFTCPLELVHDIDEGQVDPNFMKTGCHPVPCLSG
ncbi:hypothetical protein AR1Y2_3024 [Anaerostipes rhamnosivorans]|uniref:Uncharacterized protein n=1 Tax=Anaerostipes rhamnosivorans TaxID=1229621 RepID=A0A4P8IF87_9FIRM|nr:hypothetical protein AR1Y2_3024 [Anaerostipes rhamnosivorans]